MINAGYEGNDHCRIKLRNPLTWVMYIYCNIPQESPMKAYYCFNYSSRF